MFLLPSINLQLRPKILALKPGTRVVSNSFDMAGWEADEIADLSRTGECTVSYCNSLLWIVPARVAGSHKTGAGDLVLEQEFQMLKGTLKAGGKSLPVEGRVRGEEVSFTAGGKAYSGRMNGRNLELH